MLLLEGEASSKHAGNLSSGSRKAYSNFRLRQCCIAKSDVETGNVVANDSL